MKIYLTAIIKSKAEFREEVKSVLLNMVEQTRKESACLQYDLHQSKEDKNLFVFYEIWKDQSGLDEHNQQPHIKEFIEMAKEKFQVLPEIYITEKL